MSKPKQFLKPEIKIPKGSTRLKLPLRVTKYSSYLVIFLLALYGVLMFFSTYSLRSPFQSPIVKKDLSIISPVGRIVFNVIADSPLVTIYEGKVSHYSHDGCLGCSEGQIMGNGEPFDEFGMTLAVPCEDILSGEIVYGTKVIVTNLDNGKSIKGEITDCGGFSKYNRIADLSLGMAQYLETKTDITNIKIELI